VKVGFYIGRLTYAAHFGPVADYFRARGAEIALFCDYRQEPSDCGYKSYLYPSVENIQKALAGYDITIFRSVRELVDIIKRRQIQVVFFFAFDSIAREAKVFITDKTVNVIFAYLQTGSDLFFAKDITKDISSADVVYLFSENWKGWWKKWLVHFKLISPDKQEDIFKQIDTKTVISGFPQIDQVVTFDRLSICEKYAIPKDKRVIVYLPFPWRVPFSVWSHIIYKPKNKFLKIVKLLFRGEWRHIQNLPKSVDDLQVARAIRQFADQNNAFFLVKGRLKNIIPAYLREIADSVIFDQSYYPCTIYELMYIADLCIGFYSEANKESVMCNTPCICLGPTEREDWPVYAQWFFLEDFSPKPGSFYNFDGAVYNKSVEDFVENFPNETFEDYKLKPEGGEKFIEKFLGYSDFDSCSRIYKDICERLG
jgi:hypothetical protein